MELELPLVTLASSNQPHPRPPCITIITIITLFITPRVFIHFRFLSVVEQRKGWVLVSALFYLHIIITTNVCHWHH